MLCVCRAAQARLGSTARWRRGRASPSPGMSNRKRPFAAVRPGCAVCNSGSSRNANCLAGCSHWQAVGAGQRLGCRGGVRLLSHRALGAGRCSVSSMLASVCAALPAANWGGQALRAQALRALRLLLARPARPQVSAPTCALLEGSDFDRIDDELRAYDEQRETVIKRSRDIGKVAKQVGTDCCALGGAGSPPQTQLPGPVAVPGRPTVPPHSLPCQPPR